VRYGYVLFTLLFGQAACAGRLTRAQHPRPADAPTTAILEAALLWFKPGAVDTITGPPDTTAYVADTSRLVLMSRRPPGLPPFDSAWVQGLIARHILVGSCEAAKAVDCVVPVNARFITLGAPVARGGRFVVSVHDVEVNPARCREAQGRMSMWFRSLVLERSDAGWQVLPAEVGTLDSHADASCRED
jgi:hypothetical protein